MTALLPGGRRPRSRQFSPDRKPAVCAILLALVASVCSQGAFAQMERANAQFHAAQTSQLSRQPRPRPFPTLTARSSCRRTH